MTMHILISTLQGLRFYYLLSNNKLLISFYIDTNIIFTHVTSLPKLNSTLHQHLVSQISSSVDLSEFSLEVKVARASITSRHLLLYLRRE